MYEQDPGHNPGDGSFQQHVRVICTLMFHESIKAHCTRGRGEGTGISHTVAFLIHHHKTILIGILKKKKKAHTHKTKVISLHGVI